MVDFVARILTMDAYEKSDVSSVDVKEIQANTIQIMKDINLMNWQSLVCHQDGKEVAINDFESMVIAQLLDHIRMDAKTSKLLVLPLIQIKQ